MSMLHTAKSVSPYNDDNDVKPTYTIIKHSERTNKLAFKLIRLRIPFLSYTNLQRVLNKKDQEYSSNVYRFFESVKTLQFCRENPHFWLQYAILVLASRDYDRADK